MSSGVEVEDGRAVVVFSPPPPPGEGRFSVPAVEGELAVAVDGGERGPDCEVTERFVLVPCDSACICENGAVGGLGDGVGEVSLRGSDGGSEPDTGGLVMANDCVEDRVAGLNQAVDVEKSGSDVGGVEGGVRISALHEVGSNAVDSAATALHPSPLSNSGQNGSLSDRLVGEERAGEENFTIGEVRFSKLNIGEQQNNVPDELISMVDVEESAARDENTRALEAEVVRASSDVAICMFEGPSHFCASSSLPGCSFQCEENQTCIKHVACEESERKIMAVDDDKVSCHTNADLSQNVEEFVVDPGRVTEPALYDDVGKSRPLFQSSSLFVDIASTISGFHKTMNTEECSVCIINAASCNASEGSASQEISSMFGILNLTTHTSESSTGQGNSCSSPILENSGKSGLCSSLVTSLVDSCSRKNEPEGISNGTSLENSSSVAEIGSSVAEVYSPNSPSLSCRETVVYHSLPRLTRMRNAARQCRKIMEAISISVSKLRKKRSFLCRRGRSSVWGALVKIIELFEENKKLLKYGNARSKSQLGGAKPGSSKQRRKKKAQIRGSGRTSNAKPQKTALFGCSETSDADYCSMAQIADNNCPDKNDSKGNTGNQLEIAVAPDVGLDNFTTENNVLAVEIPCDKDIESTVTQDVLVENRSVDFLGISSQIVFESLEEATSGKSTLCGTSPDLAVLYMENGALEPNGKLFTFEKSISRDTDSKICSVSGSKDVNPDLIAEGKSIHSISSYGDEKYQEVYQLKSTVETVSEDVVLSTPMEGAVSVAVIPSNMLPSSSEVPCMVSNTTDVSHQMPNPDAFFNTDTTKKEKKYSRRRTVKKVNEGDFSGKLSSVNEPMFAVEMGLENGAKLETDNDVSENAFGSLESKEDLLFRKSRKAGKKQSRKKSDSVESTKGSFRGQPKGSSIKTSVSQRKNRHLLLGKRASNLQTHFVPSEADVLNRSCVAKDKKNMVLDCDLNNGTQVVNHLVDLKPLLPQMAWVLCDDCGKWRCIPVDLANKIDDTNCKWTCKDNDDKNFADCSIPQEKSNAEINAELQLSDGSGDEDFSRMGSISGSVKAKIFDAKQQASWTLIEHNLFLHRSRRTQTVDEIMVCHCKPPSDGGFGCREECLNRMLNIECVQGTCPCGNLCSNQQFQKRKYSKFKWFQCGKKGYGLQVLENVSKGQFLIEYVGETERQAGFFHCQLCYECNYVNISCHNLLKVLDMLAYETRQREYASRGQKHFYFMTLNGSEVIDACAKGNLGRFINHSCDPNCWTEKWMVNGEVCIGLFALRDIKKGEEVTFDYNYVRVFGAAAKKCMCGSSGCRGYLGGDPSNSGAIVQADSDNEYPEPVMVREDGTTVINMSEIISDSEVLSISRDQLESSKSSVQVFLSNVEDCSSKPVFNAQASSLIDAEYLQDTSVNAFWQSEAPDEKGYSNNSVVASDLQADIAHVTDGLQVRCSDPKKSEPKTKASSVSVQDRERNNNISCEINHNHLLGESTLHPQISDRNYQTAKNGSKNNKDLVKHKSRRVKQSSQCKSSNPASVIKKVSSCTNQVVAAKSKKLPVGTCGRFEGVEEKLDELLDAEGGISRSKDATKGYLKLLFVTAASGDNAIGETFQSTRDLSIILDALLKTKSRTVLHDIVNKNGLQMLHNIMKQNRRHFNRTPIIRKLLKVIEFLAAKGILTSDHINTPSRDGVESFQDSIFELMRHGDVQVHQIARRFRDQWIPTTFVKTYSNWNGARDSLSRSCHKRWHDQGAKPSEAAYCIAEPETGYVPPGASVSSEAYSVANANENVMSRPTRIRKRKSRWDQPKETNSLGENDYDICKKRITDQMIATISESTHKHDSTPSGVNNDDAPPGFSCPSSHLVPTDPFPNCGRYAVVASPQSQYLGYLPVSYGIPWALVQEFGTSEAGGTGRWLIAPGVPFHPFPPLPSYPCEPRSLCESPEVMDSQHRESAGSSQEATASRHSPKLDAKLGRRYFRQQKWNKGNGRSPAWLRPQKNGQALKDGEHSGGSTPNSATCTDNTESEVPA